MSFLTVDTEKMNGLQTKCWGLGQKYTVFLWTNIKWNVCEKLTVQI